MIKNNLIKWYFFIIWSDKKCSLRTVGAKATTRASRASGFAAVALALSATLLLRSKTSQNSAKPIHHPWLTKRRRRAISPVLSCFQRIGRRVVSVQHISCPHFVRYFFDAKSIQSDIFCNFLIFFAIFRYFLQLSAIFWYFLIFSAILSVNLSF